MAANCPVYKIDSNDTGLRFAVEKCLKELPSVGATPPDAADPVWFAMEPNSYGDFGANITTIARNPINASRQRQKGVVTDLEATASITMDLLSDNHMLFMEGFMFSHAREKAHTRNIAGEGVAVTAVTATGYSVADAVAQTFPDGALVFAKGFTSNTNNGLKLLTGVATGELTVAGLAVEASPPVEATIREVGFQFSAGDVVLGVAAGVVTLTSTAKDMRELGLLPGEWVFVGGDNSANAFPNNRGFARVDSITQTTLTLGKYHWRTPSAQSGAGISLQLFTGTVIRNEEDPDQIERTTFQFERTLGKDADGIMSQYVIGSVANELTINAPQAEKVTAEMAFVACDSEARTGLQGVKAGTRPALVPGDAFNTSSDVRRIAFNLVDDPNPLFYYATDFSLAVSNNATGLKAIGVLGNLDVSVGTFDVSGSTTGYFQDVRALNAVRENADVTVDMILAKKNSGIAFDLPLITLGNGMPAVEQDQAVTIPLDMTAAQSKFGHTLLYVNFAYLPNVA